MRLRNYKIKSKGVKKYVRNRIFIFQGMKKRIDQRISEGNYDEAAVSMQKCMEYILNSLDGRNNDYQKVCVLFEVLGKGYGKIILNTLFIGMNGKQSLNIVISRCICKENRLI